MRLHGLRTEAGDGRTGVAMTATWEEASRPPAEIRFEVRDEDGDCVRVDAASFVVPAAVAAARGGEARLAVDAEICPALRDGLQTALGLLRRWNPDHRPVRLEVRSRATAGSRAAHTGVFLSGGVDSLANLAWNHETFPPGHTLRATHGILVHGFDMGGVPARGAQADTWARTLAALGEVARATGIRLVPVWTTVRRLDPDVGFWMLELHGAALAAVGHFVGARCSTLSIASSHNLANLIPWGSSPWLDPFYSSAEVTIRHDGIRFTRLDKIRLVARTETLLPHVRVCSRAPDGLNCGRCEKCVRTMLELVALGKLQEAPFPDRDVTPALLGSVDIENPYHYRELVPLLREQGRPDLIHAIRGRVLRYLLRRRVLGTAIAVVKGVDERLLGGLVRQANRRLRRSGSGAG